MKIKQIVTLLFTLKRRNIYQRKDTFYSHSKAETIINDNIDDIFESIYTTVISKI